MKKIFTSLCFFTSSFVFAQLPAGSIAEYPLDNTAVDISSNSYHGTLSSTTATSNRFTTAGLATNFTQWVSMGTLPVELVTAMSNDFSIGFWFNSTMTANSGGQWYEGNSLIDAEVCGGTSDWGIALLNGGKVAFGIGSPDITIESPAVYNNGVWHFVTATRNMAGGNITLYVDGILVASASGTSTDALTAPEFIGLGTNNCSGEATYEGSLDDIIVYNRELSAVEAGNLYTYFSVGTLPLQWLSFTGTVNKNTTDLQWQTVNAINNDRFEIERSTDGRIFTVIGTVATGSGTYTFKDIHPATGNNFYRIRQIDTDGKYSRSSTVKILFRTGTADVYLQTNPVAAEMVLMNSNQVLIDQIQISDLSGRIVRVQELHASNSVVRLSVQNLQPGYYLVSIMSAGSSSTLSFIKQ